MRRQIPDDADVALEQAQVSAGRVEVIEVAELTPAGVVLHAVAGPVDAGTFLREARWANDTYELAQLGAPTPDQLQAFFRKAHLDRLQQEHGVRLPQHQLPVHPEKLAAHEAPVPVTLPADLASKIGPGWTADPDDTIGEFQLREWLTALGVAEAQAGTAAAGWGGDRVGYVMGPDGRWLINSDMHNRNARR